jgi:hypothetical protein
MKPAEFVRFAEATLNRPAPVPAALRSVASRAYYGAYHLIRACFEFKTGRKIEDKLLKACSHPDAKKLGMLLGELQEGRILADYKLDRGSAETPNAARRSIEMAREIENLLVVFQSEETRDQVQREVEIQELQFGTKPPRK